MWKCPECGLVSSTEISHTHGPGEPSWENGKLRTWKEQMDDDYQELILLRTDNEKLQADNARLRQQLKSLVEAWNESRFEWGRLEYAFDNVQEMEEK